MPFRCKWEEYQEHIPGYPPTGGGWHTIYMFYVYAIYNPRYDKIYIGQTAELERRIAEHSSHRIKGFTAKFQGEWKLIYHESCSTRSEALQREKQLKSAKGREYVKQYIPG